MALEFPRDLLALSHVRDASFWPMFRQELSRTAAGVTQGKDFGPPLWRGSFTTAPMRHADASAIEMGLLSLGGVLRPFEAYDPRHPYPAAHADGDFDDVSVISEIGANNKSLRLAGLPAGFVLSVGDYLSFDYGVPQSRALHRIAEASVADPAGVTDLFEVFPHVDPAVVSGVSVTLKRPSCVMVLDPSQSPPTIEGGVASSVTFSGVQVL